MKNILDKEKCIECGLCKTVCPMALFEKKDGNIIFVDSADKLCVKCGHCIAACPVDAISIYELHLNKHPKLSGNKPEINEFMQTLLSRRSIRHFKNKPVEDEKIEKIVEAVSTAPCGGSVASAGICIINGREKIDPMIPPIMEFFRKFNDNLKGGVSKIFMRTILGKDKFKALQDFSPLMDKMLYIYDHKKRDTITYGAPLLMIFHAPKTSISGEEDAVIACTYAMLAAHVQGLGTTMIGMIPPYLERNINEKRRLNIPDDNKVSLSLIAGYTDLKFSRGIERNISVHRV